MHASYHIYIILLNLVACTLAFLLHTCEYNTIDLRFAHAYCKSLARKAFEDAYREHVRMLYSFLTIKIQKTRTHIHYNYLPATTFIWSLFYYYLCIN